MLAISDNYTEVNITWDCPAEKKRNGPIMKYSIQYTKHQQVSMFVYLFVSMYIRMYTLVCFYLCLYVFMYIYTYLHGVRFALTTCVCVHVDMSFDMCI